jgi:hypothetical protein
MGDGGSSVWDLIMGGKAEGQAVVQAVGAAIPTTQTPEVNRNRLRKIPLPLRWEKTVMKMEALLRQSGGCLVPVLLWRVIPVPWPRQSQLRSAW